MNKRVLSLDDFINEASNNFVTESQNDLNIGDTVQIISYGFREICHTPKDADEKLKTTISDIDGKDYILKSADKSSVKWKMTYKNGKWILIDQFVNRRWQGNSLINADEIIINP